MNVEREDSIALFSRILSWQVSEKIYQATQRVEKESQIASLVEEHEKCSHIHKLR